MKEILKNVALGAQSLALLFTPAAAFGQEEENLLDVRITCFDSHVGLTVADQYPRTTPANVWTILEEINEEGETVGYRWLLGYNAEGKYYSGVMTIHDSVRSMVDENSLTLARDAYYRISIVKGESLNNVGKLVWPALGETIEKVEVSTFQCDNE